MFGIKQEPVMWVAGLVIAAIEAAQLIGLIDMDLAANLTGVVTILVGAVLARSQVSPVG